MGRYSLKKDQVPHPYIRLLNGNGAEFYNSSRASQTTDWTADQDRKVIRLPTPILVRGDVRVYVLDGVKQKKMCGFWFHTSFLDGQPLELMQAEMEGSMKDTKNTIFPSGFRIKVQLRPVSGPEDEALACPQDAVSQEAPYAGEGGALSGSFPDKKKSLTRKQGFGFGKRLTMKMKHVVSQQRKRYQEDGFDLDLSYVTSNIIAMGFPSEGAAGLYRNSMPDVQEFFAHYHRGTFKVYNLCSEKSYEASKFEATGGQVAAYPFDDHQPCPLDVLVDFCQDAMRYLEESPKHVVAIHCKGGKGRTGLMCCALLLWSGVCNSAEEAMLFYSNSRTHDGRGVTGASQRRYVGYVERFLGECCGPGKELHELPLLLTGFRFIS